MLPHKPKGSVGYRRPHKTKQNRGTKVFNGCGSLTRPMGTYMNEQVIITTECAL
jgi:hypothetical protein